jgi:molecular chaperone GrpE (heat shock protein)
MSQDKEEHEVGIPLEDLSSSSSPPDTNADSIAAEASAADEGLGLPSLFDAEELAEVGLTATPFGDSDDMAAPAPAPDDDLTGGSNSVEDPPEPDPICEVPNPVEILGEDLEGFDTVEPLSGVNEIGLQSPLMEGMSEEDLPESEGDAPPSQPEYTDLQHQFNAIQAQLVQLQNEFSGKLKYDAHKDQIIDKLHQELQEYKQDIVKKHILSIVLDVVKVADDIRKWIAYFRSLDVSQRDPVKLFRYLEAIPSDLEDIFYWQGVKPYATREGIFDPARQRAIKKIPTDDDAKDKTIAKSIRPGYEWEGKIIRQEMVAVYIHKDGQDSVDTRNIDE